MFSVKVYIELHWMVREDTPSVKCRVRPRQGTLDSAPVARSWLSYLYRPVAVTVRTGTCLIFLVVFFDLFKEFI